MKIVVIGLGSMGKRRIRLTKQLGIAEAIYGVDSRSDRREETENTYGIQTFTSVDEALRVDPHIDGAFVCTSPLSHAAIIRDCLKNDLHVFTEINLVPDGYSENSALASERGKVLFLSSTFLYREEVRRIIDRVDRHEHDLRYIYHIGQYLPDWHPWENYNDFFVGNKRTNGCREILAIELPWILRSFGEVTDIQSTHSKNSDLSLNYDDNYFIKLTHKNGTTGVLCVDVVSPKAVRNLEVFGEKFYISWNGTPSGMTEFDGEKTVPVSFEKPFEQLSNYQATIVENAYAEEIKAFFAAVEHGERPLHNFERDAIVLDLIDRIEE